LLPFSSPTHPIARRFLPQLFAPLFTLSVLAVPRDGRLKPHTVLCYPVGNLDPFCVRPSPHTPPRQRVLIQLLSSFLRIHFDQEDFSLESAEGTECKKSFFHVILPWSVHSVCNLSFSLVSSSPWLCDHRRIRMLVFFLLTWLNLSAGQTDDTSTL